MKTIQLWCCIYPQKTMFYFISKEDLDCAITPCLPSSYYPNHLNFFSINVYHLIGIITLSMSTSYWSILFIFCLLCCTVVVLSSTLLLLQSSLLLHQNQNIREEKERYYAITNHIFASVCDRNILSMSNLMDIFSSTS